MTNIPTLGFIGLGTMGGPMCRNLIDRSHHATVVYDIDSSKVSSLVALGARGGNSIAEVVACSDIVFLCLPGEPELREVAFGEQGVLDSVRAGRTIVDMTTATVAVARELGTELAYRDVNFADAPVAKGVPSAVDGTLSIMVRAGDDVFARIEPLLRCMGTEVNHCGVIGSGQVVKLMNNMLLFQTVSALAETLAIGTRAGVDGETLFDILSKGSADSFALRRHGKYMARSEYPDNLFSSQYSLKDLTYALQLADQVGVDAQGAKLVAGRLQEVIERGFGDRYSPVIYKLFEPLQESSNE